jgi:hypothetical protein
MSYLRYPFINYSQTYPAGHPNVVVYDKDVEWKKPEDMVDELGNDILGVCYKKDNHFD